MDKYGVPVISLRIVRDDTISFEKRFCIRSPADVHTLLASRMADSAREIMMVVHLDAKNRVLAVEPVIMGSVNEMHVVIGELFKSALVNNAYGIVLVHNRPSMDVIPSPEDIEVMKLAVAAGELLGVVVHDHLILGGDRFLSLRERGLGGLI